MADISIQAGCIFKGYDGMVNHWLYQYAVGTDLVIVLFIADVDLVPQIGDTIVGGELVKKTGPIINNDPGFQAKKINNQQEVWPIDRKNAN